MTNQEEKSQASSHENDDNSMNNDEIINDIRDEDFEDGGEFLEDEMDGEEFEENEYEEGTTPSIFKFDLHQEPILKCDLLTNSDKGTLIGFYASQDDSASAMVFDTNSYICLYTQRLQGYHDDSVIDIKLNFDKTLLATAGMDGTIGVYDVSKLNIVDKEWKDKNEKETPLLVEHQVQLQGTDQEIEWIQWHPKGNALLSSSEGTCWLWNVKKMDCMSVLAGHSGSVTCGGFINDGKQIITGSDDATVRIWNPMPAKTIHTFEGDLFSHGSPIISMYIREDLPIVYVGNDVGEIISCSVGNAPKILQKYTGGHTDSIESIDYSTFMPNILVSGSMDQLVGVWDDRVNKIRTKLQCNDGVVKVKCSSKAPVVYSCSMDGEIRIWDLRNGQCIDRLVGHTEGIFDFAVSTKNDFIITASDDSTSRIYETNLDMLLQ